MTHTFLYRLNFKKLFSRIVSSMLASLALLAIFAISFGNPESFIWIAISTVSLGGALAGISYYFLCDFLKPQGIIQILIMAGSTIIFIIGFWLSLVFALAQVGLWD